MIYSSYQRDYFDRLIPDKIAFHHDKFSVSKKGALRGLHGDKKTWKLISCIAGKIFQVVLDCRPQSDTYHKWQGWFLTQDEPVFILVPPLFANGYCALNNNSVYHYKLAYEGEYYDVEEQFGRKWDDPRYNIRWPIDNPILESRDK